MAKIMADEKVGELWRLHYPYRHMNDVISTDEDSSVIIELIRKLIEQEAELIAWQNGKKAHDAGDIHTAVLKFGIDWNEYKRE